MKQILQTLKDEGNLRQLLETHTQQKYIIYRNKPYLNLSSNDYLALSDTMLQVEFFNEINLQERFILSNPSSRLMTGNSVDYTALETTLAQLYKRESALVLGSGFLLNSGLLPAVTESGDLVLADKLVHASIIEGLRLCRCHWERFRHNDMDHLRQLLEKKRNDYNRVYVVTESIFSMDGDIAPLKELSKLKQQYDLCLYVDEAHAFGVRGESGCGICEEQKVTEQIDYIVGTLGKALCSQGAFVICSEEAKQVLVNKMRTLIFSTALPPISLMWSKFLIDKLPSFTERRNVLENNRKLLRNALSDCPSESHILPVIVPGNFQVLERAKTLRERGYWVTAIRCPTVPKNRERIRVSLTSGLNEDDILNFISILKSCN